MAAYLRRGTPHRRPERVTCHRCGELVAAPNLLQHQAAATCERSRAARERRERFELSGLGTGGRHA